MKIRLVSWPRVAAALVTLAALAALQPAIPGAGGRAVAQSARGGGFLGVMLQDFDNDLRDSYDFRGDGVLITEVNGDSPAERAGLHRGDIVTRYRGRSVHSSSELTDQVRASREGDRVSLTVWREGRERTISVTLGSAGDSRAPRAPAPPELRDRGDNDEDTPEAPESPTPPRAPRERSYHFHSDDGADDLSRGFAMMGSRPRLGVELQDLDSDLGGYFSRPDGKGVLVLHVVDGSAAKAAGIRAGDVIVELEGRAVSDAEDLRRELGNRDAGPVRVTVIRRGARQTLTARLSERSDPMAMGSPRAQMFRLNGRDMRDMPELRGLMGRDGSDQQRELRRQMDDLRKQMDDLRREMQRLHRERGQSDRN